MKQLGVPEIIEIPNSLDFLFRKRVLSEKEYYLLVDWLEDIIYEQREYICQHSLDSVNSKADFSGGFKPLSEYDISELSGLPLSTRAVWFWKFHTYPPNEGFREITVDDHTAEFRDETDHVWGYTRNGRWAVATVSYLSEHDYPGHSPYRKILRVNVEGVTGPKEVSRIVEISASEIYIKLLLTLERWYQKRQELYEKSKVVHDQLLLVYNLISKAR